MTTRFKIPSVRHPFCFSAALGMISVFSMTGPVLAHEVSSWRELPKVHQQRPYPNEGHLYSPTSHGREAAYRTYSHPHSSPSAEGVTPVRPLDPWQQAQQQAQKCQRGRLLGGIVGGGVGYVASRNEGRSWAVPLGALLGSQMGCSTAAGRGPVPW